MGVHVDFDEPLTRYAWAKFDQFSGDWFPLYAHLEDTAEVARLLFDKWLSDAQVDTLERALGPRLLVKKLTIWLAAAHDCGKATEAFAMKAPPCQLHMESEGYRFQEIKPTRDDQRRYPHGLAGQVAVAAFLSEKSDGGRGVRAARALAQVVGGHHGSFPGDPDIPYVFSHGEKPEWGRVREDLLRRADRLAGMEGDDWGQILQARIPEPVQALLTGFLIVCDWIASNRTDFPFHDERPSKERAADAVDRLGFGERWRPQLIEDIERYFDERFGISVPRPVQRAAVECAASLDEPSLLVIEAPTGEGKTEAALASAEVLAAKFGLRGVMVALPTRATANAMFGRVLRWLESRHAGDTASISLAHAKAQFDEQFQSLFARRCDERPQRVYDEDQGRHGSDAAVIANQWFNGRKRTGLADFVIGTIDQLLFMTLKARHTVLRHLGLSRKVVVIDEIHTADHFMRTYLLRALQWLGSYGVPVIALSATLPSQQREELLHAYRRGARRRSPAPEPIDEGDVDETILDLAGTDGYPLVTTVGAECQQQVAPDRSGRRAEVELEEIGDDELIPAVLREAEAGGIIAVVHNTVQRAQDTYKQLRRCYHGEVKLFHSRFTVESRNAREQELVEILGPGSGRRPEAMIVVATQVVESSLDVDFDLMFTDVAPTDLLIQRIGRVHRHPRPEGARPVSMRRPRVCLTGGSGLLSGEEPPEFDRGVRAVYGDALLLRSAAALRRNRRERDADAIRVPEDVPELIRDTYRSVPEPLPGWEERQAVAETRLAEKKLDQLNRSRSYALDPPGVGRIADWSRLAFSEASEEQLGAAQVRDAELSIEVVVVQEVGGVCRALPWLHEPFGGEQVDLTAGIDERLAKAVATCTVALPSWMTRGSGLDGVLDELERNGIEGWQRSIWLRGMLPLVLDEDLGTVVNGYRVRYDRELGLLIEGKDTV